MKLDDVILWIKLHNGEPMVRGGKSAAAKAASAASKTAATAVRAAANKAGSTLSSSPNKSGGTDYRVGLSDSVGVSDGGTYDAGIKATVRRSDGSGGYVNINVGGLTPEQASEKIKNTQQQNLVESRINQAQEQLDLENKAISDTKQKKIDDYNKRFPTKFGKYEVGGNVVGVTTGSEPDLARLNKQITESQLIQLNKDQYALLNYTQRGEVRGGLSNQAEFKKFNEKLKEQGGKELTAVGKNVLGGNAFKVGLEDSVSVKGDIGGSYGDSSLFGKTPEQKPAPAPQISSSNFAYDEGGTATVTYTGEKYFPRENRQEVKDFLKANPAESYNIYDERGKLVKTTSGRYAYPDILRAGLAGQVSILPVTKLKANQSYLALGAGNPLFITEKPIKENAVFGPQQLDRVYGPPEEPTYYRESPLNLKPLPVRPDLPFKDKTESKINNLLGLNFRPERAYNEVIPFLSGVANIGFKAATEVASSLESGARLDTSTIPFTITNKNKRKTEAQKLYEEYKAPSYPKGSREEKEQMIGEFSGVLAGAGAIQKAATVGITKVGTYITDSKLVKDAIQDFSKVFAPKQTGQIKLTENIPVIPEGELMTVYHGTSVTSGMSIIKTGFKTRVGELILGGKGKPRVVTEDVYGSTDKKLAETYGNFRATIEGQKIKDSTVILEITGKKEDFSLLSKGKNTLFKEGVNSVYTIPDESILNIRVIKGPSYLKGQTYNPQGISLGKNIGGESMVPSKVTGKVIKIGEEKFVKLESTSPKQDRLLLYNPRTKQGFALEEITKDANLPENFNIRGPLANDIERQIAQQNKFGLTQVDKNLFKYVKGMGLDEQGEINLVRALKSESVASIGRVKSFSLEQIQKNPRAFGRFFFGGEEAPVKPISDIGLLETKGYNVLESLTGKSKADKYLISNIKEKFEVTSKSANLNKKLTTVEGYGMEPLKGRVGYPKGLGKNLRKLLNLGNKEPSFEAFNIGKGTLFTKVKSGFGKLNLYNYRTFEKFSKRLKTSSYVSEIQKFSQGFENPFSITKKGGFYKSKYTPYTKETTKESQKIPAGNKNQILTTTTKQRDEFSKLVVKQTKSEMDILFQSPRFKGVYGGTFFGLGTKQLGTYEYGEPNRQMDRGPRMIESPQAGEFENIYDFNKNINVKTKKEKYNAFQNEKIFETVKPKKDTLNALLIDITPKQSGKTKPETRLGLLTGIFQELTPFQGTKLKQTPITTQELVPVFTPELVVEPIPDPFRPVPEGKLPVGGGGLPYYNFGGGGDNEFSGKKSKKFYSIFDISKTPFGKISRYVGYQEQSYSPIEEITRKSKNPIAFLRPESITNFKYENVFDLEKTTKRKTGKKGSSKRNKYGFPNQNLF